MPAGAAAVVARDGVDTDRSLATGCSELRSGFLGGGGGGTFLLRSYKNRQQPTREWSTCKPPATKS